jgi:hypothetical protein
MTDQPFRVVLQPLFLDDLKLSTRVKVRPLVLLSIIDFYSRRAPTQERVIGTLLGHKLENEVTVTNCFMVPHSETEHEVGIHYSVKN